MLMTDSRQESVRLNCSLLMRQEIFCRNNGGLEKLIAGAHFTVLPLPHYHPSRVKLLLNASAFLPCSSSVFAAFSDLNSRKTDARKTSPKLLPIQNRRLSPSNRKCNR